MTKLLGHVRANLIAYCALFIALGGTSYAAISIPRNSVGTSQLRNGAVTVRKLANGSITSAKLDKNSLAGSVVFWARISQSGQVVSSSEPAQTSGWATGRGTVVFRGQVSSKCFALANIATPPFGLTGYLNTLSVASLSGQEHLTVFMEAGATGQFAPLPIVLAEICP